MSNFTKHMVDIASPVDAAGNPRKVPNGEMQVWGTEVESEITGLKSTVAVIGQSDTVSTSANLVLTVSDRGKLVSVDASEGARAITLPPIAVAGSGFSVVIKAFNAANFVTVQASGAELISGIGYFRLTLTGQTVTLRCNGLSWDVVSESGTLEVGSTADGTYYKFADGRLVCVGKGPGASATSAQGAMFVGDETWNYPHVMAGAGPFLALARVQSSNRLVNTRAATSAFAIARHFSTISDAASIAADFRVEGRWF